MRSALLSSAASLLALLGFSSCSFAQTYGTDGYAPGAWKPDELPKELSTAKPFNPHDLSGVWSTPTTTGYFERHSLNDKWFDVKDKKVPPQMRSNASPPPMTDWGKAKFDATKVSYGPRAVAPELNNDPVSQCEPLGYPRDLWEANLRPFEFIQTPDRVLQHMQYHDVWRTIWTDGRALRPARCFSFSRPGRASGDPPCGWHSIRGDARRSGRKHWDRARLSTPAAHRDPVPPSGFSNRIACGHSGPARRFLRASDRCPAK